MIEIGKELDESDSSNVDEADREAAQKFYGWLLGGRPVRAAEAGTTRTLAFLVEGTLVVTGPHVRRSSSHIALRVEDTDRIATRCWNAGFTVRANHDSRLAVLTVVDPFGLNIALIPRSCEGEQGDADGPIVESA